MRISSGKEGRKKIVCVAYAMTTHKSLNFFVTKIKRGIGWKIMCVWEREGGKKGVEGGWGGSRPGGQPWLLCDVSWVFSNVFLVKKGKS